MAYPLNDLGGALTAQLSKIVSGGDAHVQMPKDTFVTYCCPGFPMKKEMFDFAANGFGSGKDAEAEKQMVNAAYQWARMVDFVPALTEPIRLKQEDGVYRPDGTKHMSSMYGEILRFSKVVHTPLTKKEKAKLERYRQLLQVMVKKRDLITGKKKLVPEDGPIVKAYNEGATNYRKAALLYNAKRVSAETATGPEGKAAVADWRNNALIYRDEVTAAMRAWESTGYKNDLEAIWAYIAQVTRRDMKLWKASLVDRYDASVQSALGPGQDFRFTSLLPGDFATSDGWTGFGVNHTHVNGHTHDESSSWKAGAGVNWGLWSFGANASGEKQEHDEHREVSSFGLEFELAQVIIDRNWLYDEWFINRGWTLRQGEGWFYSGMPSDGGDPPAGEMIGYPTMALFARNVKITSSEFVSDYKTAASKVGVSGSVGWGPISISGGYSHAESETDTQVDTNGQWLKVPGMQLIGFINHAIPKSPNPLPTIPANRFE